MITTDMEKDIGYKLHIDRVLIRKVFADYTARYNAQDPKIRLKIDHTYRVADICEKIAVAEGLDEYSCSLAWVSGMLHDIGRFEQVRRYGTFADSASINHAEFGADLLFGEGLIGSFFPDDMSGSVSDLELLRLAIRVHSDYRIPENVSKREKLYCDILRDADKVDIFRVNVETTMEVIYNVTTEDLRKSKITPDVLKAYCEGHAVLRSLKRTPLDHLVGHAALAFELVYHESRRIAAEQGYISRLLSFESEDDETEKQLKMIRDKMSYYLKYNERYYKERTAWRTERS